MKLICSIHSVALLSQGSSPVDHRSLDDLCTSTYTMSQKLCARCTLGARYLYFKRIVESWAAVSENCVRNGFIKARGDEAVSGDSDYVHDDTFSEMEEEGMEEIPKEILNAILSM